MSWTEYTKTANVEAVLIEDPQDVPLDAAARPHEDPAVRGRFTGRVVVKTSDGEVTVQPPFYLVRYPGREGHAWPCNVEDFEDWYEEVN